jgi:hypothetical protein
MRTNVRTLDISCPAFIHDLTSLIFTDIIPDENQGNPVSTAKISHGLPDFIPGT